MDWTFCFGCDEEVRSGLILRRVQKLFTETDELKGRRETAQRTSCSVCSTEEAKHIGGGAYLVDDQLLRTEITVNFESDSKMNE